MLNSIWISTYNCDKALVLTVANLASSSPKKCIIMPSFKCSSYEMCSPSLDCLSDLKSSFMRFDELVLPTSKCRSGQGRAQTVQSLLHLCIGFVRLC